jgi:hypothetical protein
MLATLANKTPPQAAAILAALAESLLPNPSETTEVAHEDVLRDIASTYRLDPADQVGLLNAVHWELQSVLLPAERVVDARRRLAAKGLLPRSLYEIRVPEGVILLPEGDAHRCAQEPHQIKVYPAVSGSDNMVAVATRQVDDHLTSIVWGRSEGAIFLVTGGAWIFHDRLGYTTTALVPIEALLPAFLADFGFDVAIAGRGVSRVFWNVTIPAPPGAKNGNGFYDFVQVMAPPGRPFQLEAIARLSILQLFVVDLLFCIDTLRYRAELAQRGMWIPESLRDITDNATKSSS